MKQRIVINSSPIIFLAKLHALHILRRYHVIIPDSVYEEITRKETIDQDRIKKFLESEFVEKSDIGVSESSTKLGNGEMSVICLAHMEKIKTVIMDDRKAWMKAEYYDLAPKGTLWVIIQAYRYKDITKNQAKDLIMSLPEVGFYMSNAVLAYILRELERATSSNSP